jgi:hypothetical protein
MMKPHRHAALIHAWADGAEIQYWNESFSSWHTLSSAPTWDEDAEYRIKPEKEYPKSSLSYEQLCNIWSAAHKVEGNEGVATVALRMCADAAVRQYIRENEE